MKRNQLSRASVLLICLIVGIFFPLITSQSMATTYCVANETDLIAALNNARDNSQDDVIKIQQGTYYGNFAYASMESFGVTIEGGYGDPLCTVRIVDPENTIFDGEQNGAVLALSAPDVAANFSVDGRRFKMERQQVMQEDYLLRPIGAMSQ